MSVNRSYKPYPAWCLHYGGKRVFEKREIISYSNRFVTLANGEDILLHGKYSRWFLTRQEGLDYIHDLLEQENRVAKELIERNEKRLATLEKEAP